MEEELKCPYCLDFYCNPVLLPCFHSLCYACALHLQEKFNGNAPAPAHKKAVNAPSTNGVGGVGSQSMLSTSTAASLQSLANSLNLRLNGGTIGSISSTSSGASTLTTIAGNGGQKRAAHAAETSPSSSAASLSPQSSISSSSSINIDQICSSRALSITDLGSSIVSDLDKLSVFSETDSGVVGSSSVSCSNSSTSSASSGSNTSCTVTSGCSSMNGSRPCSYLSSSSPAPSNNSSYYNHHFSKSAQQHQQQHSSSSHHQSTTSLLPPPPPLPLFQATPLYSTFLPCPQCSRMIYMDETGVDSLTKNTCLENIVERYTESKKLNIKCQMCPPSSMLPPPPTTTTTTDGQALGSGPNERDAVIMCEQCEIYYCEQCRESCHPMRGPLMKHTLVAPKLGRDLIKRKNRIKESKCSDHMSEFVSLYCMLCKSSCCSLCVNDSVHMNHQMQQINIFCKSQKTELTQILQSLSEKAKSATEFVARLKTLPELIEDNSGQVKSALLDEIDEMIRLLELKKKELVEFIDLEKASKIKSIKEQISYLSSKVQKTTGLLQYCVETLKEPDPTSFLQISDHMITKMSDIENKFPVDADLQPKLELDFDFMLNSESLLKEIKKLNCKQIKVPTAPSFVAEDCITEPNETIILSWNQKSGGKNSVQGYVLEIDDGLMDGAFKEVYCGPDTICQVNGLCANSVYNARVKAFNQAGCSEYSPIISVPASPTMWFSLNPKTSHSDAVFSNNFTSATCVSFEDRVVLGTIGFSKGVHYWEITVDRYDNQPDPAFGVARYDVARDHMLGKDNKSWCMYIDCKRSWFMHNGKHFNRVDNGIQQACVIGVLLDLNNYTLSYYVNDESHGGGVAFTKLPKGVYYPAFSLNKNVQITLNSGLEPPPCLDNSDID